MRIGLIGCGSIGQSVAGAILAGEAVGLKLVAIAASSMKESLRAVAERHGCLATANIDDFFTCDLDLIVEAASQDAAREYVPLFVGRGISVVSVSIGAYVDSDFYAAMQDSARQNNCRLFLPSGAIGGLDLLLAAREDRLDRVVLTTRKPPQSLEGAALTLDIPGILAANRPVIVYEGNAREAVKLFPKNINVAAAISLAGVGPDNTLVRVIADPGVVRNIHEVEAEGAFGRFKLVVENKPSPDNAKTSYTASLSVIALIRKINHSILIGN